MTISDGLVGSPEPRPLRVRRAGWGLGTGKGEWVQVGKRELCRVLRKQLFALRDWYLGQGTITSPHTSLSKSRGYAPVSWL
jgi:hypothetical protein